MTLRFVLAFAVGLVLLAAAPGRAFACLCGGTSEDDALADASLAFVGVITSIRDPAGPFAPWASTGDPLLYHFFVEEMLKGEPGEQIVVRSPRLGSSCGLEMAVGERWRIYTYRHEGAEWVGLCGASQRLATGVPVPAAPASTYLLLAVLAGLVVLGVSAFAIKRTSPLPSPGPR